MRRSELHAAPAVRLVMPQPSHLCPPATSDPNRCLRPISAWRRGRRSWVRCLFDVTCTATKSSPSGRGRNALVHALPACHQSAPHGSAAATASEPRTPGIGGQRTRLPATCFCRPELPHLNAHADGGGPQREEGTQQCAYGRLRHGECTGCLRAAGVRLQALAQLDMGGL